MPYPSNDAPWVIPEILADEIFEDVQYLLAVARRRIDLLPKEETEEHDASFYLGAELVGLLRMGVIITAAAMEAMANQELQVHALYEDHGRDPLEEKWDLLYEKAELKPKKGHRPWQSLPKLTKLRNRLVHHVPTEIVLGRRPYGSVKMELLASDGEAVFQMADDSIAIVGAYLDVKDPEEGERLRDQWSAEKFPLMRTLPWMDIEAAAALPRLERLDPQ